VDVRLVVVLSVDKSKVELSMVFSVVDSKFEIVELSVALCVAEDEYDVELVVVISEIDGMSVVSSVFSVTLEPVVVIYVVSITVVVDTVEVSSSAMVLDALVISSVVEIREVESIVEVKSGKLQEKLPKSLQVPFSHVMLLLAPSIS
jgi:hypothetical protein